VHTLRETAEEKNKEGMEGCQAVLLVTSVLTETGGEGAVSYMKNCTYISLTHLLSWKIYF
jgi:hypothetical protein